jgi:hypothetical protein
MYSIQPELAILLQAGFIGHLAKTQDISFENMKTAIIVGSAMASFCVEKFGVNRLKGNNKTMILTQVAGICSPRKF